MIRPAASVIVRAKNKQSTIGQTLSLLRQQTVESEIIVVDSGSTDGTLEIARRFCDRLIEIPAETFTYGRALNIGASAASAPVHFSVSAHCFPRRLDWIERSLAHYERADVAGTSGFTGCVPQCGIAGRSYLRREEIVYQDTALFTCDPFWGFSNHASSWRASVWAGFPFNETIEAAEDKEWVWRVLRAGWVIVMDPALAVASTHRFQDGLLNYHRRALRDNRGVASFAPLPPYTFAELVRDWWRVLRDDHRSATRLRLSPWRLLSLAARYSGARSAPEHDAS